jgi:hypothetical protein
MTDSSAPQPRDFRDWQRQFTARIRDPDNAPIPPGIDPKRMATYERLIYNGNEDLLSAAFPVMRSLYDDAGWERLMRAYLAEHRAQIPMFPEIGNEIVRYIEARQERGADDPPFLAELAHYEYAEVILSNDDAEIDAVPHDRDGDLIAGVPVLSPLAWPLAYRFPVQRICPEFQPHEPPAQPTCLIMVRRRDDTIKFIESTPMTLRLLQLMKENPDATGLMIVNALADLFDPGERGAAVDGATRMLHDLRDRDVILGTRPA